jgi:hypothetical protein
MSFRNNKDKTLRWKTWLQKHRDELIGYGIPLMVLEDIGYWFYFLEHGYFTPPGSAEPIIDIDRMSKADAERLCLFLEHDDFYPECSTLKELQYLLRRGRHAETSNDKA